MNTATDTTADVEARSVEFTDEPNAVTIRISGAAYANLKEIAAIFTKWQVDEQNTPADIVRRFLCNNDDWLYLDEKNPDAPSKPQTLAGRICCAFDNCEDEPQLEAAFNAAGFNTQY